MSDWGAVNQRVAGLKAGLELEPPSCNGVNDREIVKAVQDGTLDEKVLDQAVERLLKIIFRFADHREDQEFALEADHELALHIAEESMVLLKNEESILSLAPQDYDMKEMEVAYPFGHGLSYTNFTYSNLLRCRSSCGGRNRRCGYPHFFCNRTNLAARDPFSPAAKLCFY